MDLAQLPALFDSLPTQATKEHHFRVGQTIFAQQAPTVGLWFVRRGVADLRRITEAGHPVLLHRAVTNELFAEASLFSDVYHCSAIAMSDCDLLSLERSAMLDRMRTHAEFAIQFSALLARQVQAYRGLVNILSIRNADERVYEAAIAGLLGDDLKAFAARIGLTHESVYRALASLTEQNRLVKTGRGRYSVNPMPGAQR